MRFRGCSIAFALGLCLVSGGGPVMGQPATARIETTSLRLMDPDPYQVTAVLEPVRRVRLIAPADGLIRGVPAHLGENVRESQDLVLFDPTEANARYRVAAAELRGRQFGQDKPETDPARLRYEAAQAEVDLARAALERCNVRAPFPGRVVDVPVCAGQYVLKGTVLVELADTASLRAVLPVDRRSVTVGSTLKVAVEDREADGKVLALLPLPDHYGTLRDLATPFAAAAVVFPNAKGQLDAGLRARPAGVPVSPLANIPRRALKADDLRGPSSSMVQVIRNEYVTNIPVHVLGGIGPERIQVSGEFRDADALIVGASVPLAPGTLVRFNEGPAARGIEATSPNPAHGGAEAAITSPGGSTPPVSTGRGTTGKRRTVRPPATAPVQAGSGGGTPF